MSFVNLLLEKLNINSDRTWIQSDEGSFTCGEILHQINSMTEHVTDSFNQGLTGKVIGIAMKTSLDLVIADLMCLKERAISLPIPLEFEDQQIRSLLGNADVVLVRNSHDAERLLAILQDVPIINIHGKLVNDIRQSNPITKDLSGIVKIIHTSGTTSEPKGVMIRDDSLTVLVQSLLSVFPQKPLRYLSITPMSLLVEQIFAVYCTLLKDGELIILPESVNEFGGHAASSSIYFELINQFKPDFMYLAPKLLEDVNRLQSVISSGLHSDGYYITGGAKVNHDTLRALDEKGIKIYEGYGLSETTSVVSINGPDDRRIGTAGKILPHLDFKVVEGELLLKGPSLCAGYFTRDESSCEIDNEGYLHTGDLVEVDGERYLTIKGRKKNLIILSNARNISPEWVESKIKRNSFIDECVIIGDGCDHLTALLSSNTPFDIQSTIDSVNQELPRFAQIGDYITIENLPEFRRTYFTMTGRPRRPLIHKEFAHGG